MKKKRMYLICCIVLFFLIGLTVLSPSVFAENGEGTYCPPPDPPEIPGGELNGVVVIPPQIMQTAVTQTANLISKRISQINALKSYAAPVSANDHGMGISAGDEDQKFGVWANLSLTDSRDNRLLRKVLDKDLYISDANFDLYNYIAGMDYKIAETAVIGTAFSYEYIDDGYFAYIGKESRYNMIDSKGFTIAPYFSVKIGEIVTVDLNAGYSWLKIDQNSTTIKESESKDSERITSSLDAERIFGSVAANLYYSIDKWNIAASIGYLYAEEDKEKYTESNGKTIDEDTIKLGQFRVGGEISYVINTVEPYLNLTYEYDTTHEEKLGKDFEYDNYDKRGFVIGGGLRFQLTDNLIGDFQAAGITGRENYDEFSIAVNLRYIF